MKRVFVNLASVLFSILLFVNFLLCGTGIRGTVRDMAGSAVPGARVSLLTSRQTFLASSSTDSEGRFAFTDIPAGTCLLTVAAKGFALHRRAVTSRPDESMELIVTLELRPLEDAVTITAVIGSVEDSGMVIQPVNVIGEDGLRERATAVVSQVANEESGVHLQRTSPTMAGIFVRGLTGNKVNVFLDGVRYSNSAARGGVNTFLDLVEPSILESVEILRGASSAQYGSDAIGGSVQLQSRLPVLSSSGIPELHGSLDTLFSSADSAGASNLTSSYGSRRFALLVNLSGHRASKLRPGGGYDSHAAVTRFLGLPSRILGGLRLPDTAFTQYGGMVKTIWELNPLSQMVMHYSRSQIDGGKRYDQLLGGDGNLVADLRNLMTDFAYWRYNRFKLGWFDHFSAAYSVNSQREERVNQGGNGNPRGAIAHEYERTVVQGVQAHLSRQTGKHQVSSGAEFHHERIHAPSFSVNPVSQTSAVRRGRIPDNTRYDAGGIYLQDIFDAMTNRLRLVGSVRYSAASYRTRASGGALVGGKPLWPDDALRVSDIAYRTGMILTIAPELSLFANLSRGFRAPHMTDLGTFGLSGSGFEIAAPDVAGMDAQVGSSAGADAVSTGRKVEQVKPERNWSYEAGARYRVRAITSDVAIFVNTIHDSITKQALILPPGAVGLNLAGQPITTQGSSGVVYVASATNPVLVRTNYDDARICGVEHALDWRAAPDLTFSTRFTWLHARDLRTNLPPNIEGGTPAPDGYLKIRYSPVKRGLWFEPYLHAAGRQGRLSSLDLDDRRTGAGRSRTSIRNFFFNGATSRGLVGRGADGTIGTADDVLMATGEILTRVQDRVLGSGVQSAPMFVAVPGYITFNLRAGMRIGEKQDVLMDFSNIGDRNYRGISWGLDAPGRAIAVRYRIRW